ncbi:retrovirus-related pol polyprotein from transposon TNT 1-94 [Tanacetum coccineum]
MLSRGINGKVDARLQNFKIQFLKEAAKFVRDFKSLAKEADESLAKHKALELEIERLLRAVVSQDIMSIVQSNSVVDTSNLQTELERTKERFENCIIKKENEYAKLWNDWYKKCEECKYDKISYDKAYNDMQQKIERLQAQLGDQKGKSKDTPCVSNTLDPLSQKLENENVELEFQVLNYAKENAHLKTTYKNLFDSISVTRTQTKTIIDSLQNKLHDTIYENAKLRAQLFDKVSEQKDTTKGTSVNTQFCKQSILGKPPSSRSKLYAVTPFPKSKGLPKIDETHALSKPVTSNSVPTPQESKVMKNDNVIAPGMFRINPFKPSREEKFMPNKVRARVDNTAKTRRPQPRSNTKNDMVPSASKNSCIKNKEVEVEEHHRNLLPSKNKKHMSSECNNIKLAIRNDKSKVVYAMCYPNLFMVRRLGLFQAYDRESKASHQFFWKFLGTVRFRNDHVAAILGFGDLQWGNILITRVYFVKGLGHNLFLVGQFCDSDLEVAFRRNTCFVRNLKGVDLLKGNRTTNLYTINLHDMASASLICLMAHATSTKSWLWHQHLSHLNFYSINDLARNDLVTGLPKFKYHKEHLCPSCEQGKRKRASHPPKLVPNSKKRLHLLHMDLCGPMRIASINGKRVGISHQASSVRTPQQNRVVERRNRTLVEADRTMLIFSCASLFLWAKAIATACYTQNRSIIHPRFDNTPYELINNRIPDISFLHVFGALCYPKNDREDIGKLGAKGDIGFFIGYSANSCAYRVYNRRTKKIMEIMNVTFDELSAMVFEQSSLKHGLQSMTSGQITMYDDYIDGQPSTATRTIPATNIPNTSPDVDELETPETVADNVPNAMFDGNTFVNPFATPLMCSKALNL